MTRWKNQGSTNQEAVCQIEQRTYEKDILLSSNILCMAVFRYRICPLNIHGC